ncbi:MAG: tetratricopeptide repeat protein [Rhizobiaceae bacterium]
MYRILSFVFLLLTTSTAAADTKRGIDLFNNQDYAAAEQEFLDPVAAGDPVAIRYYANMLYLGRGIAKDKPRAKEMLRKAYRGGDAASGTYLASLLTDFFANDMPTDLTAEDFSRLREAQELLEATYTGPTKQQPATNIVQIFIQTESKIAPKDNIIVWFKRAVREGHGVSAWQLANAYSSGNGVKRNEKDAFYWAEYAAFLGHAEAQNIVGEIYTEGRFGPVRRAEGLALVVQAAKERHNPAMLHVAGHFTSTDDLGMAWRVLDLARRRGMEETSGSKRLSDYLMSKSADQMGKSIEDYTYNGRFETLIQSTEPDYQAALKDFSGRIRPYSE